MTCTGSQSFHKTKRILNGIYMCPQNRRISWMCPVKTWSSLNYESLQLSVMMPCKRGLLKLVRESSNFTPFLIFPWWPNTSAWKRKQHSAMGLRLGNWGSKAVHRLWRGVWPGDLTEVPFALWLLSWVRVPGSRAWDKDLVQRSWWWECCPGRAIGGEGSRPGRGVGQDVTPITGGGPHSGAQAPPPDDSQSWA